MDLIIAEPGRPRWHVVGQVHCGATILDRFEHSVVRNCLHQLTVSEVPRMGLERSSVSTVTMPFKAMASPTVHLEEQRGVLRVGGSGRKDDGCKKRHTQA